MDLDEKAMLLMDELFEGRARKLDDVIAAFNQRGVPTYETYLKSYGISTTRKEIEGTGSRWCYKGATQIERIKNDVWAGEEIARLIERWEGRIPVRHIRGRKTKYYEKIREKQSLGRCLKDLGYYNTGSYFEFVGYELHEEDRDWFFEELIWALDNSRWPLDFEELWMEHGDLWHERISEVAARRCVEIANRHRSTDVKAIFPIGS
jgi:hypothetical protein